MTGAKPLFIDTNALVYANVEESPFHHQTLQALQAAYQSQRPLWISRQVLREYLVTMTRQQIFETLPRETVLEQVNQFVQRFQVADDTPAVTQQLIDLMTQYNIGGKQVHDTNIVATMLANNIDCLLTHNSKDFARFEKITIEGIDG
jgi:predicted nucleic acid-binding protein